METLEVREGSTQADCVVSTNHTAFDYGRTLDEAGLVVYTRNALKGRNSSKIVRL